MMATKRFKLLLIAALCPEMASALESYSTVSSLPQTDGALVEHLLLLPAGDACHASTGLMAGHWHFSMTPGQTAERRLVLADGALAAALGWNTADEADPSMACGQAYCLERGTPVEFVAHWHRRFDPNAHHDLFPASPSASVQEKFEAWFLPTCQAAEIGFVSYHPNPINVFWVHTGTQERVPQGELSSGERNTSWRSTYLGHVFYLEDAHTKEPIGVYQVLYTAFYVVGSNAQPPPLSEAENAVKKASAEATLKMEYGRSRVVTRTFSSTGFDKGSLPSLDPHLWGSIQAYYHNNKGHGAVREEWDHKGLYVNWWEVLVEVIQIPWQLKLKWHERMRGLVEEWIGGEELERTDIYGIRVYHKGARLLSHVDRSETHAASLILNIAQEADTAALSSHEDRGQTRNGSVDWPVQILDLADHMHEVVMGPGDLVYYESARCLHSRMQPLHSGTYANLFVHYRPKDDPQWYTKPNPPHTPAPVSAEDHRAALSADPAVEQAALASEMERSATTRPPKGEEDSKEADSFQFNSRPSLGGSPEPSSRDKKAGTQSSGLSLNGAGGTVGGRVHLRPLAGADALVDFWHFTNRTASENSDSSSSSSRSNERQSPSGEL
mmetsp:Transcript_50578/g.100023  ORF Transcript_50578/g.100023 Transcript_50578/m.100023 type:complete len:611 (-) Transcript_50578:128-1960(-)